MAKRKDRMAELIKQLREATGIPFSFYGSNGLYSCSGISPFNYFNGYHSQRDICLYIEGILAGMSFNK